MLSEDRYFQELSGDELWRRYCGFLDLSLTEFMNIQKELLVDELERVADSTLGKKIMNGNKPKSVEEFRQTVPLTTYEDYEPYLSQRQEDALAIKPAVWCHSAGRGGTFKWLPRCPELIEKINKSFLGAMILASAGRRGEVNVAPGLRMFLMLPPPPYASGSEIENLTECFSFKAIPPLGAVRNLGFEERMEKGFQMALGDGIDFIAGIGSILAKMGQDFGAQSRRKKSSSAMLHPKVVCRLLRAWLYSRREGRGIWPKDLWPMKGILTGGVDTAIYRSEINRYWGVEPYEFYVCSEVSRLAMQGWNKKGMVFLPDMAFLEFIPHEEQLRHRGDKNYRPSTVLLDEVREGKLYEVVITHFYGGPLLRYRMEDLIKVVALEDRDAGVHLPQISFQRRLDEAINLAGLAELDEKMIWQAIANTGVKYVEWSACKEYDGNQTFLRLYLELEENKQVADLERMIDEQLRTLDTDYKDIAEYLKLQPVRVTLVAPGTFERYMDEKRREGADRAHMKPPHVNPPEETIQRLRQLSEVSTK